LRPSCSEESNEKKPRNGQKNDVLNGRVIEADRHFDDLSASLRRDHPEKVKKEFDQQCSNDHCDIKTGDNKAGDFPAVILPVDIDDREDDQVGINERDDAAETDAAVPKDRSQRNVAHGTNE